MSTRYQVIEWDQQEALAEAAVLAANKLQTDTSEPDPVPDSKPEAPVPIAPKVEDFDC